jgi:hypothetical protein
MEHSNLYYFYMMTNFTTFMGCGLEEMERTGWAPRWDPQHLVRVTHQSSFMHAGLAPAGAREGGQGLGNERLLYRA